MKTKAFSVFLGFLVALFAQNIFTAAFKNEGAIKDILGPKIKPAILELLAIDIPAVKEFYETVLQQVTLNEAQTAELNQDLAKLKKLEDNYKILALDDLNKGLADFVADHYLKATFLYAITLMPNEPTQKSIISKASQKCAEKCEEAAQKFSNAVLEAWNDFYKGLSAAELEANSDYKEINDELQAAFTKEQELKAGSLLNTIKAIV